MSLTGAIKRWHEHFKKIQSHTTVTLFETPDEKQVRIKKAKNDFAWFVSYYFPHYAEYATPDFHVSLANYVKKHPESQTIVRWGRGLGKSVVCDIFIPLWLWINGEPVYELLIGNNLDKAKILLGDVQLEFEANERLIHDYGKQVVSGNWTDGYFVCKDGFIGKAIGMGQDARGLRHSAQRPNYIVADDLEDKDTVKNPKRQNEVAQWIERAVIPSMDGQIQRYLHPNNNFAPRTIQDELWKKHPDWKMHRVDACPGPDRKPRWHQKYTQDYYKKREKAIGTIALDAEYNNRPFIEGSVFTEDMIQWAKPPRWDHFQMLVGMWDVAYSGKNDYNAVRIWGLYKHNFWLMKSFVRQCKMRDALWFMYNFNATLPKGVYIHWKVESQFWNDPLREAIADCEDKWRKMPFPPINISIIESPKVKKIDRLLSMHPYYQNRRIYWNIDEKANNDIQAGMAQLFGIEPGYRTPDDAPDADEQAISQLVRADKQMAFDPVIGKRETTHSW